MNSTNHNIDNASKAPHVANALNDALIKALVFAFGEAYVSWEKYLDSDLPQLYFEKTNDAFMRMVSIYYALIGK